MLESQLQAKIIHRLQKVKGCYVVRVRSTVRAGTPDIICCFYEKFIAIEVKIGKGKLSTLQQKNIDKIVECGGRGLIVNEENFEASMGWFDEVSKAMEDPKILEKFEIAKAAQQRLDEKESPLIIPEGM